MITALLRLLKSLLGWYAATVVGGLITIPIAMTLAPVWHYVHSLPYELVETVAMLIYIPMALIGVGFIVDFLSPASADPAPVPAPSEAAEPEDLTPALPSGPRPEYVRGRFQIYRGHLTTLPRE